MCSDHTHLRRIAKVNSNTLIVFIAPNRLCDYETLLHQNVHQHAVFPIAIIPFGTRAVGADPWSNMSIRCIHIYAKFILYESGYVRGKFLTHII